MFLQAQCQTCQLLLYHSATNLCQLASKQKAAQVQPQARGRHRGSAPAAPLTCPASHLSPWTALLKAAPASWQQQLRKMRRPEREMTEARRHGWQTTRHQGLKLQQSQQHKWWMPIASVMQSRSTAAGRWWPHLVLYRPQHLQQCRYQRSSSSNGICLLHPHQSHHKWSWSSTLHSTWLPAPPQVMPPAAAAIYQKLQQSP